MSASSRIGWIDAARGLGVVLVVFGHVERGLTAAGLPGDWSVWDYTLYAFHMPLFFLLAGMNVAHSLSRGRVGFLSGKAQTIVYPYVLWSLIQGGLLALASSVTNAKGGFSDLLYIGWRPIAQFWFLYALMLCHLVVAVVGLRRWLLIPIGAAALITSQFLPNDGILERFLFSLPFFLCGALASNAIGRWRYPSWLVMLPLWALFAVAVVYARFVSPRDYSSIAALPAAILGIAAMLATANTLRGRALAVAAFIGLASMSIYVMHIIAASGLRIVMMKIGAPTEPWLYALSCTAFGVAAPLAAHWTLERLNLLRYFGLAPWPRRTTTLVAQPR